MWSSIQDQSSFVGFKEHSRICNGIVLIDKQADCCEFFNFATSQKNLNIIQFYLNNIDILWRHTFHFKEKAFDLIKKAHNDRLILPKCNKNKIDKENKSDIKDKLVHSYLLDTPIRRYYIIAHGIQTHLTESEAKCCFYLIKGMSLKEIASILSLSARTVENHINNFKQKTNCGTKATLIKILRKETHLAKICF